jgi:hypothetical protein
MPAELILESTLTCPECGTRAVEEMPTDACVFFYACRSCRTVLTPKSGDCCVFCSYGSVRCPPIQSETACCGSTDSVSTA